MSFSKQKVKPRNSLDLSATLKDAVYLSDRADLECTYLVKRAPNVIEWAIRTDFAKQPTFQDHWGQYKLLKDFFQLRCPICNVGPKAVPDNPWGLSRETLSSEVLLVWSERYQDDICPKCHSTRSELVDDCKFAQYRELIAIIGQRSGKSSVLAMIATYVEHIAYTIAHSVKDGLYGYFGLPPGDLLQMTFVAATAVMAEETIWAKFRGYRSVSPWMQRYTAWLEIQEATQEVVPGMPAKIYIENQAQIKNEFVRLHISSLNSNSDNIAGRTNLFVGIDEICRMEQGEGIRSAKEIYRTMFASVQTIQRRVERFGLTPFFGMLGSISSPKSVDDWGMKLLEHCTIDKQKFGIKAATWDFSPFEPKAAYRDALRTDYVGTMRNFGACPPGAANPLIDRELDFRLCAIDQDLTPTATFDYYSFIESDYDYAACRVSDSELVLGGSPRYIAVDAGASFDAFAVACAHTEIDERQEKITVFDWVIRIITRNKKQEVYFDCLYNIIEHLKDKVTIAAIEFDHWNSKYLTQRIRTDFNGIRAEEVTGKDIHYIEFMRDAYQGKVRLLPELPEDKLLDPPYKSAQGAAIYELLKLERDKNDKIFNPNKGLRVGWNSDDTARVIVHAHKLCAESGWTKRHFDESKEAKRKRHEANKTAWLTQGRGGLLPSSGNW